jgi:hypothetical protein
MDSPDRSDNMRNFFQHLAGDRDELEAVCSKPYKGLDDRIGYGFKWPYLDYDNNFLYDNLPRRQCALWEHRRINDCLKAASSTTPISDEACMQCIPGVASLARIGQSVPTATDPWPPSVLPVCVPIPNDLVPAINRSHSQVRDWKDLEPIPDNFAEQIIKGCGRNNQTYGSNFVYDSNRHLCTDRYKVKVPCNEVNLDYFSQSQVSCDNLASTTSNLDGPDVEYTICQAGPTPSSCVDMTNEDGSVAMCTNHLKKCTLDDWLAVARENPEIDPRNLWCYAEPPSTDTCSNVFDPGNCAEGSYPISHFPVMDGYDPLCLPDGCSSDYCCLYPKCSYDFDSSTCPNGTSVPDRLLYRRCMTSPCTPEECCDT